jgi:hypothetical protein
MVMNLFQKTTKFLFQIIPLEYRKDPKILHSVYTWLLAGLLIRLLIMPFACHGDLLSTYHRSFLLIYDHNLQYLNPQEIIQAINLVVFSPIDQFRNFLVWNGVNYVGIPFWLDSMKNITAFRTLFIFKIPYLIFDFASGFLLLFYFKDQISKGVSALAFWLLNPITIFTFYIFARHDAIAIFFIILCVLLLKNNKLFWASLALGIAIWSRTYGLMFVPVLLILVKDDLKKIITVLIASMSPLILFNLFIKLFFGYMPTADFSDSTFINYLLAMKLDLVNTNQIIYIFIFAYFFVLFFIYSLNLKNTDLNFSKYCLIVLLLYYATSIFHPQYFSWFIPFLAIIYATYQDDLIINLHCVQIFSFIFFIIVWGADLSNWLIVSINPDVLTTMQTPLDIFSMISPNFPFPNINIFRTILSASSIFMIIYIIKNDLGAFLCRTKN